MKQLLTMLITRRAPGGWWELRSSEGDPPNERVGHYIFSALIAIIRSKLNHVRGDHDETTEKTD